MNYNEEIEALVDYEFSHKYNHTLHAYIDIAGDLISGTLLSQIMYWFSEDKNHKRRVRVFKDGQYWLAKGREEWMDEIRISKKQYDTAMEKLRNKGFVETKLYKFNTVPTTHIRPIYKNVNLEVKKWKNDVKNCIIAQKSNEFSVLPKGENGNYPNGEMDITQRDNSLTMITNSDYQTNNLYSATTSHENDILSKVSSITSDLTVRNGIEYYLSKYETEMGVKHPDVTFSALDKIIDNIKTVLQDGYDDIVADNGLVKMIDRHFDTNYGMRIDYRLNHFGTEGILEYQARNCGYIEGYKD